MHRKRFFSLAFVWLLAAGSMSAQTLTITPTTTLARETSNNTSAADSFRTQSNGNLGASNISKEPLRKLLYPGATTKIYARVMPWFGPSNHMNVGYSSNDAAQVKRQVEDAISRGMDGLIMDWYGRPRTTSSTFIHNATALLLAEIETHAGFEFAISYDKGALKSCAATSGCSLTQTLIDDLNYVNDKFFVSSSYMRKDGRPVLHFFGMSVYSIDWNRVRNSVRGNPLFIFRNTPAYKQTQSNGGYSWLGISNSSTSTGVGYLTNFYDVSENYPAMHTFGSAYPGFDDSLAAWGENRYTPRLCGKTWLATWAEANKVYSTANPLESLMLVTWNDYEEGTALESGVDNCVRVSASRTDKTLSWTISGDPATLDHFLVFISLDGTNLMRLAKVGVSTRSLDLGSYSLAAGSYKLFVKAVGKPSIKNQMSAAVSYDVAAAVQRKVNVVTPVADSTVPTTVRVSANATSPSQVNRLEVWVDGKKVQQAFASNIDVDVPMAAGTRRVVVQAVDASGASFKDTRYITVVESGVNISSPGANATTSARVVASAASPAGIDLMQIYIDGKKVKDVRASSLDELITMTAGTRRLTVQAYDKNGALYKQTKYVTVK